MTRRERRALARQNTKHAPVQPKRPSWWYWLGPCLAAFCVYFQSLSFGFIRDDVDQIVKNPQVQSWSFLFRLLTTDLWSQLPHDAHRVHYYRPIFSVWMLLIHTLVGLDVGLWHFSNVCLHVVATYLVFRLCLELLGNLTAAGFGALLFALNPIHIESVSWVSASDEILYTMFVLGLLLSLIVGIRQQNLPCQVLSLGLWAVALLTKETAIALLPLLCGIAILGKRWKLTAGYIAMAVAFLIVRGIVLRSFSNDVIISWRETAYGIPGAMLFYLEKLLLPVGLSPIYETTVISSPTIQVWLYAAVLVLAALLALWLAKKSFATGVAFSLIALPIVPVLVGMHFFPLAQAVHDRYLYLPSVGISIAFGLVAKTEKRVVVLIGFILATIYGWLCIGQQGPYANVESYCARAAEIAPGSKVCHWVIVY